MGNYVENNLGTGETIVKKAELSKIAFAAVIISFALKCFIPVAFAHWILNWATEGDSFFSGMFIVLYIGIIILIALVVVGGIITYRTTELAVTNKAVIGKTGLINTKVLNSPLDKVQNVTVEQKFLGKIFHYATIVINTASSSKDEYKYEWINDADNLRKTIMSSVEQNQEDRMKKQTEEMAKATANAMNNNSNQ